jgi:Ran-binding protein 3
MSGFGSTSTSGFGSLKSGFAGVGGGFAAAGKSGGLTNFASPNAPATLGGEPKSAKPIGADESGDEGSDNDEGEETSTFEADKTDERFYEQTSMSFLPHALQSIIHTNIRAQSRLVRRRK